MQNLAQHSMIWLYRCLVTTTALVALIPGLIVSKKLRQGLAGRWRQARQLSAGERKPTTSHTPSPRFLIHAASGEFEYAKPVIRALKAEFPSCHITATYFSPSYAKNVHGFSEVDEAYYLPLDLSWSCRRFLRRLRPDLVLIARTDLWPEWLWQCRRQNIPVWLFSATKNLTQSGPVRGLTKSLRRFPYSLLEEIHCVSSEDRDQLIHLGLDSAKVFVGGDTRFDQVLHRLAQPKPLKEELRPAFSKDQAILVAGSTWTEDERALLPATRDLLAQSQLRLIIAPHEPSSSHIEGLKTLLNNLSLPFDIYSTCKGPWTSPVLIIDQVGILADLYSWGDLAFVGGSFKGPVHSVMEPLATGLVTLVGPRHQNNREAMEFQKLPLKEPSISMVLACSSAEELSQQLQQLVCSDLERLRHSRTLIQTEVNNRRGASQSLVERVANRLPKT